ncbi:hypothetical protein SO802_008654 [Lithocarpus litseifolius]|uniref:Uncharacterized protein n=1 Tax=Lithocarpus litseifolius TaxID=425828 RepID=A0AAW2D9U5_9ROSI
MIDHGLEDTTKRKKSKGEWNAAIFIIFVEVAERFTFIGLASNLIMYLTDELHEPTSTAAKNLNTWVGVSCVFPIVGAFIADSYLGRFKTIVVASFIYCTGMVLLILSVSVIPLHYRKALFFFALYILAVGEGGHKPCVQTFAADQFDQNLPEEKKAKSSFFNWWYFGIMVGATSAIIVVVYMEDHISWVAGFGTLASTLGVSLAIFLLGIKRYRKQGPIGSPFTKVVQVFVAAALVEVAERFTFCSLASNLIVYLTDELHEPTSTAAKNVDTWIGVSCVFPIVGAFIADSYLGRFSTILVASIIYCTGMVLLTLSVSIVPLHYRKLLFFVALYILAVGEGGHKPCAQTFAADQFDHNLLEQKKPKSSFFNWWFFGITVGSTFAVLVAVYIKDNISWAACFGTLTLTMGVSLAIFLSGIKKYRKQGPLGSPFTMVAQVLVATSRKWHTDEKHGVFGVCFGDEITEVHLEAQPSLTQALAHTNQFRFLDKAMIIDDIDASMKNSIFYYIFLPLFSILPFFTPKERSLNQVEEVKLVLRLIPIWLNSIMLGIVATNFSTYFTKQGTTMIRSIGPNFQLPAASLQALFGLTVMITTAFYDQVLVPITKKFSGHHSGITLLQRVGTGLCISLLTMVVAALVEAKRISIAKQYDLMEKPE